MTTPTTIEVNGVRLAYRQSGQGEPLVLVHGHISDMRSWAALEKRLAQHFCVYAYSKRFAWPNEPIAEGEPQPWERDADDLVAFVRALNVESVHAVGNSSSSTNILCAARRES
ncbi:hypothetical protein RBB50_010701 [Rhinocladiella similis]